MTLRSPPPVESSIGTRTLKLVFGVAAFAGILALYGFRVHSLLTPPGPVEDPALWGMEDFRNSVYYPVRAMLDGLNPYYSSRYIAAYPPDEPFGLYSPAVLLLHLPFGLLPRGPAHLAFFLFSALLILVIAVLLLRVVSVRVTAARAFWVAAFLAAGRPVYMMMTLGQSTLILVVGVILALHYAASKPVLAGVGLSLAVLKPTFGVPLAILMLARRDYRAVWIGVLVAVASAAIPTAILLAGGGLEEFVAAIRDNLTVYTDQRVNRLDADSWGRIDAAVAVTRVFGAPILGSLSLVLAAVVLGAASWKVARLRKAGADARGASLSSLVVCLAILVGVYHQTYDGALLALPLMALVLARPSPLRGGKRVAALFLLVAVWFNYLSTSTALARLGFEPWGWPWRLATSTTSLALGTVLVLALLERLGPGSGSSTATAASA